MKNYCRWMDWNIIAYQESEDRQKTIVDEIISGKDQALIVCEHPSVITFGKTSDSNNILASPQVLEDLHVSAIKTNRGGDVTIHSVGQLIIYPIFNLNFYEKDLHAFLRKLEEVVIDLLSDFGIVANRFSGKTGVWIKDKKIASIGVGVRKWVTFHGIGLNVNTDLKLFTLIRPCGLSVQMTSMEDSMKTRVSMDAVKNQIKLKFSKQFNLNMI